jgi:hypothetical protein
MDTPSEPKRTGWYNAAEALVPALIGLDAVVLAWSGAREGVRSFCDLLTMTLGG